MAVRDLGGASSEDSQTREFFQRLALANLEADQFLNTLGVLRAAGTISARGLGQVRSARAARSLPRSGMKLNLKLNDIRSRHSENSEPCHGGP